MAAGVGVGAVDDAHSRRGHRLPEHREGARPGRLEVGEPFHRVAAHPGEAVPVVLVVAEEQVDLVAEVHAALDEHLDVGRLEQPAVLDLVAPGVGGQPQRVGAVQVDHRLQPLGVRLAAGGLELGRRQVRHAAEADARRREDLDDVGPRRRPVAHVGADLVRRAGVLAHRPERRQQPRAGHLPAVDPRPELGVLGRAQALHGGDAVHQRAVCVLGAVQRQVGDAGVVLGPVHPAVVVEVVPDVHVGVDVAGQHRQGGQVVDPVAAAGAARDDLGDAPVANDEIAVLQHPAAPVENAGGAEHRRLARGLAERGRTCPEGAQDGRQHAGGRPPDGGGSSSMTHGYAPGPTVRADAEMTVHSNAPAPGAADAAAARNERRRRPA